ncbi:Peptidase M23 [uncultured Sporomusa sp.]|uniref:Peptidase M23 n=1 Tax=uncultured Sporomusa sp. TaxID=307249 RepID=A0A212M165_9FIRM|nr:M23 family metallopeptidase [uncultured Sporomusa sp.]SCM83553.1 Peptidase M23 [uncultured Sporomusa sp.]
MPRRIWGKVAGCRYGRQAMTAGVLLAVASVMLLGVISALQQAAPLPPVAAPVSETVPLPEAAATANLPEPVNTGSIQEATTAPTIPEAVVAEDNSAVNEAIQALWRGGITHAFGWQLHPLYGDWRYHNGVDIGGGEGQIVPALLSGEVVDVYTDKAYGLTVAVRSGKYTVYYSSLASAAVQKNAMLKPGTPIGSMGICGGEPEPHLHLAVKTNDGQKAVNPQELFPDIPARALQQN